MSKTALITGINGQCGHEMARRLLSRGYTVTGLVRDFERLNPILRDASSIKLIEGDIAQFCPTAALVAKGGFDAVVNLAAISHVGGSFQDPHNVMIVNGYAVNNMLEAIRAGSPNTKFVQASTVEIYGDVTGTITEETCTKPVSPYGVAKLFAHDCVKLYREAYGLFAANAILSNMESTARDDRFITRKISMWAANYSRNQPHTLCVGNLDATRDWGHVSDYTEGMARILDDENPEDYIFCTERSTTVRNLIVQAACVVGMHLTWSGRETNEKAYDQHGNLAVSVDPKYYRAVDIDSRKISSRKARANLGWSPTYSSTAIISDMVRHDSSHKVPPTCSSHDE